MITGEDQPDEGQVAVDRGVTIGYFSQDVGEMSGRSAVSEVMDGAGPVSTVAAELKELEAAMGTRTARTRWRRSSSATAKYRDASRNWTATPWRAGA
jgi:ATPase subunit of ABC transporter with duplicated ATPase domains